MNLKETAAVTLTELLIATMIFSIVMLGAFSVDFALRQSQQSTSRNALVAMRTAATMLHIVRNAQLATGSQNNLGIRTDLFPSTLCIRTEDPLNRNPDPSSYADDIWTCYTRTNNDIRACRRGGGGNLPANPCTNVDEQVGTAGMNPNGFVCTLDADLANRNLTLEIMLSSRFDFAANEDPITNPPYTLISRVNPLSHSF